MEYNRIVFSENNLNDKQKKKNIKHQIEKIYKPYFENFIGKRIVLKNNQLSGEVMKNFPFINPSYGQREKYPKNKLIKMDNIRVYIETKRGFIYCNVFVDFKDNFSFSLGEYDLNGILTNIHPIFSPVLNKEVEEKLISKYNYHLNQLYTLKKVIEEL